MENIQVLNFIKNVLDSMPNGWLSTTTHRLDIYNEKLAKVEFLDRFESLFNDNIADPNSLEKLPTAYDYIRLGHPLSSVLEWSIAKLNNLNAKNIISFSSKTIPLLAILRKNMLEDISTIIYYNGELPTGFDADTVRSIYDYKFELKKVADLSEVNDSKKQHPERSSIYISNHDSTDSFNFPSFDTNNGIDFYVSVYEDMGSVLLISGDQDESYISDIQHVRRRETIAMTPNNCLSVLKLMTNQPIIAHNSNASGSNKTKVIDLINKATGTNLKPLIASSGLSIQYAILMGLIHDAIENHNEKEIKVIVPTNCYGGTNDQARRVAACLSNVEVVDWAVDGDNDMVKSIDDILYNVAIEDGIPLIIAEIPTNPRVEVPDLDQLKKVLSKIRKTDQDEVAIDPVFILDQTFCPNVLFLGEGESLSSIRTISFSSGSKFPSGGLCTAGYCVGNDRTSGLLSKIEKHLELCDNEATEAQYEILANQMPSMNQRILDAYNNTREFVNFIKEVLPEAKINFVSEELASEGFTPSVFSLDLPTKGNTDEDRETYKRALNLKLINLMITEIPHESKFCVSYGQLKGCYWTIPATSTQGTTKEGDKDYIVRASLSPKMDLDLHKKVFLKFVDTI